MSRIVYPLPRIFPISQGFGEDPATYGPGGHLGLDFACNLQPVYATAGTVYIAQEDWQDPALPLYRQRRGKYVGIDTDDGLYIVYAHLDSIDGLKARDRVEDFQIIGVSGNTGMLTTGPHLHFAVYHWPTPINPMSLDLWSPGA